MVCVRVWGGPSLGDWVGKGVREKDEGIMKNRKKKCFDLHHVIYLRIVKSVYLFNVLLLFEGQILTCDILLHS